MVEIQAINLNRNEGITVYCLESDKEKLHS